MKVEEGQERARPLSDSIDFNYLQILAFETPDSVRQRRANETRARILAEAAHAFLDRGYNDVSTHEVAAAAGITQGLINYHFKSKEGLWQATMDQVFGGYRNSLLRRLQKLRPGSERELFVGFIRHIVHLTTSGPPVFRLVSEPMGNANQHHVWLIQQHIRPIFDAVTHLFEVGQHKGILRRLPPTNAYYVLMTATSVFSLKDEIRMVADQEVGGADFASGHLDCLLAMLLADPVE